jgi:hypothetical protein
LVALITAIVITLVLVGVAVIYARRRQPGASLTWGEAMLAGVYMFFVSFLAFGVVPHQWLAYADNELRWRKDAILIGPGATTLTNFPFSVTKETVRDIIVTIIYGIGLTGLVYFAVWWQKRGKKPAAPEIATSTYGRPLVRKG